MSDERTQHQREAGRMYVALWELLQKMPREQQRPEDQQFNYMLTTVPAVQLAVSEEGE